AHDEISQSLAGLFSKYAEQFHAAVEQTGELGANRFAERITAAASGYGLTEVSNSWLLELKLFLSSFQPLIGLAEMNVEHCATLPLPEQLYLAAISSIAALELPIIVPILLGGAALFIVAYIALILFEAYVLHAPYLGF